MFFINTSDILLLSLLSPTYDVNNMLLATNDLIQISLLMSLGVDLLFNIFIYGTVIREKQLFWFEWVVE